jgi:hypothetical protein
MLESLHARMDLTENDRKHYINLKKGYEGELKFDSMTEKLQCDCLLLNDLRLKMNNTHFQMDSLMITLEGICMFEVKNFEGDFFYERDKLFMRNKTEINHPLIQLRRNESLLRQLLQDLGWNNIPIDSKVVFINPEFTLYQAPLNLPFIYPTQIPKYFRKLNTTPSKLTKKHLILADKLVSCHLEKFPFLQLPEYEYTQLQKGITCESCRSFSVAVKGMKAVCGGCGHKEEVDEAVLRSVKEFKLLFPGQKITTNKIQEWCKIIDSKKTIKRILSKNFTPEGVRQWTYYQ